MQGIIIINTHYYLSNKSNEKKAKCICKNKNKDMNDI